LAYGQGGLTLRIREPTNGKLMTKAQSSYKEVRGLTRGLQVLRALNANSRCPVAVATICETTNLHRTTVKRLLETFRQLGYVEHDRDTGRYSLRSSVRQLSCGYVDDEWMAEVARPVMQMLGKSAIWPTNLVVFDVDAMLIRETTHFRRPLLSEERYMLGQRIPILLTAAGRAFFFSCSEKTRQEIIDLLARKNDEEGFLARDMAKLRELQRQTEKAKCGFNVKSWHAHLDRLAIAVPIKRENEAVGSISMVFHAQALSIEEAIENHLPLLKVAADRIEHAMKSPASVS
jgi:IclR family mhp operon transcriptional activator